MPKNRWYLEAKTSEAEKILTEYPEFKKQVISEDILHNLETKKGDTVSEVYRCDHDFIIQFRTYVNATSKESGDTRQFIDYFRVYARYGRGPLEEATPLFKVRRWKKKTDQTNKKRKHRT